MGPLNFSLLYALCLALCFGGIELLRATWTIEPPLPPPQKVERMGELAPPRPEGVRKVHGQGDEAEYRYTEEGCLKYEPGEFRDTCFMQLARQRAPTDLEGGLAACPAIGDPDARQECMAAVAELYAPVDREASLTVCPTIEKKKWSDQCFFGIALALSQIDSPYAFRLCDRAGQWYEHCRHDVNGEISEVNPELALANCAAEEGDLLTRKSCWHGIGKYIGRIDIDKALETCTRVPLGPDRLYRENCVHGVGWAGAEKLDREFAAECHRAGEQKDSCLLGVAYNIRRIDVQGGLEICAAVGRQDLREQCLRFVSGGRL